MPPGSSKFRDEMNRVNKRNAAANSAAKKKAARAVLDAVRHRAAYLKQVEKALYDETEKLKKIKKLMTAIIDDKKKSYYYNNNNYFI